MRIMVVGGSGGLGKLLCPLLEKEHEVMALSSGDIDLEDPFSIGMEIMERDPEAIINMAAVNIDSSISKSNRKDVEKQLNVNVLGNYWLIHQFINQRQLARPPQRLGGRYIYISSILSDRPVPGAGVYSACKAFNDNLIKTAALENASRGITFNSIQLGYFGAGLCERLPEQIKEKVLKDIPLHRWGQIEELKNLVDYFINTEYATGTTVKLTGGLGI